MGPEYKSISRFETDADVALDDDNHGQAKKSKVDTPQSSNISTASSCEDFYHLDPKHLPRSNNPIIPQENGQSPQRDDHDVWSQGGTSPISDIMLQNMSPTQTPPVQVMERERHGDNSDYDPDRIPSSAFVTSPSPGEWSAASNDSLFSIGLGNRATPQDHNGKVHEDPLKFKKPFPAMERKGDNKKSEVENKSESDGPHTGVPKENTDRNQVKFSPIEVTFSPAPVLRSDESGLDVPDFVAPIKKSGCKLIMCTCTCPRCWCWCCSCRWSSCCSCKWPSCSSCKWPSCSSCKWPSCCSCKWPSCSSCKLSSCCSCKWPSCSLCKWPSCSSCKWPSCCSCKWPSCSSCKLSSCCSCKWPSCSLCKISSCCCCPCKWPSCSSCGWPSCPRCSLKCFKCPNFSCGCPSCSSCSIMCCSWKSCKCASCSWPSICCLKCEPKKLFCCFSKVSPDDQPKRGSNKRSRCFSWSWFSCCRCC